MICFANLLRGASRAALLPALLLSACAGQLAGTSTSLEPGPDSAQHLAAAELALEQRDFPTAAAELTLAAEKSSEVAMAGRATQLTMGTGFDALAVRSATRWIELSPEDPRPREILARLLLRRHEPDRAAEQLAVALRAGDPLQDEGYLALAASLSREDQPRQVTRVLARLAAADPLSPGLQLALGTAAQRSGDFDLALAAAEAASADDPAWVEPQLLKARVLAATGYLSEALALLKPRLGEDASGRARIEYAQLLVAAGRPDEASALLDSLARGDEPRADVIRARALLALARGDVAAAVDGLKALALTDNDRFEAFFYLGEIAASQGDIETARRLHGRITSGPFLVAAMLAEAGRMPPEDALDRLADFARDYPADAYEVLDFRARLLQSLDRPQDALQAYDEAVEYKPDAVGIRLARAAILEQLGQLDEALGDLEHASMVAPDDALPLNAWGYTLANRTSRVRRAYTLVRRALELQPQSPPIQDSMGWVLYKMGRWREAQSFLEEAYAAMADPEIGSHLAEVSWRLGEREQARDLLFAALVAYPDSDPARTTAARLVR